VSSPTVHDLARRLTALENELRRPQPPLAPVPLAVGDLVQIHADSGAGYEGLPALVEELRAGRYYCSILRPHRGGIRFPFRSVDLCRVGALPQPRHRWLDPAAEALWLQRLS
jgi:hypothetical protein